MKLAALLTLVLLMPGCVSLRPAPCSCPIAEPPAALLTVPAPLPPLPVDLPVKP